MKITKFIFLELETVIENTCAETTRDPAACVRCASFLADRKACEAEEDEDGHAICKFVKKMNPIPLDIVSSTQLMVAVAEAEAETITEYKYKYKIAMVKETVIFCCVWFVEFF